MAFTVFRTLLQHECERTSGRSIITIARLMLADAFANGASDIHVDPNPQQTHVRLRIDGELAISYFLPLDCHTELVSRLKILSRLRIDEHNSPQDGRFVFKIPDSPEEFDVRVSILPTQHGESVVLRLLVPPGGKDSLAELGLTEQQREQITDVLGLTHGIVLIVGPTGSGKTTTLYALIRELLDAHRSIVSIEDPVEYSLPGVRQVQVRPQHGLSFAEGLRAILRQDPDIIVIGEIRDSETANIAMNAARTGHLVLSTLHAVDAEGTFARLEELEVSRSRLESVRLVIISQQLIRIQGVAGRRGKFTFFNV